MILHAHNAILIICSTLYCCYVLELCDKFAFRCIQPDGDETGMAAGGAVKESLLSEP